MKIIHNTNWLGRSILTVSKKSSVGEVKVKLLIFLSYSGDIPGNFRDIAASADVGLATVSDTLSILISSGLLAKEKVDNVKKYFIKEI